jgi:predicted ATPase
VVPMMHGLKRKPMGTLETLVFRQEVAGALDPWYFPAQNMSDGTLRALGVLTALFQGNQDYSPSLIGIEEPETALHPAASAALREALTKASATTQVMVTSHSPDLLDDRSIQPEHILAVVSKGGETQIGPLDAASISVMRDHLFSAGELLRLNQLKPDEEFLREQSSTPDMFGALSQ